MTTIGILHPGQMGASIGAAATAKATVIWAGDGRSDATAARARDAGLTDIGPVADLCATADVVVSICPPAAAIDVAEMVGGSGFAGTYVDANAISPATAKRVGALVTAGGATFVDGGVIGPPAHSPGTTRMYLAGPGSAELAQVWAGSALDARSLSDSAEEAAASALKMAYAGFTKGQSALLLAVNALAERAGVRGALADEWAISQPGLGERSERMAGAVSAKAWRFSGEMAEIAATMAEAGIPPDFHLGAGELYHRLAGFKDRPETTLDEAIAAISTGGAG